MGAQNLKVVPKAAQVTLESGQRLKDVLGGFLDLKPFESEHDDLQIGKEGVRRNREDSFLNG